MIYLNMTHRCDSKLIGYEYTDFTNERKTTTELTLKQNYIIITG